MFQLEGPAGKQKGVRKSLQIVKIPALTHVCRPIQGVLRKQVTECEVCRDAFLVKKSNQRFCSSDCRLLSWTVDALIEALKKGKVDGLKTRIRKLNDDASVESGGNS